MKTLRWIGLWLLSVTCSIVIADDIVPQVLNFNLGSLENVGSTFYINGIGDNSTFAGNYYDNNGIRQGYVWTPSTGFIQIIIPGVDESWSYDVDHVSKQGEVSGTACAPIDPSLPNGACKMFVWSSPTDIFSYDFPAKYRVDDWAHYYPPATIAVNSSGKLLAGASLKSADGSHYLKSWFVVDTKANPPSIVEIPDPTLPSEPSWGIEMYGFNDEGWAVGTFLRSMSGAAYITDYPIATQVTASGASPFVYFSSLGSWDASQYREPEQGKRMNNSYVLLGFPSSVWKIGASPDKFLNFTDPAGLGWVNAVGTISDNNLVLAPSYIVSLDLFDSNGNLTPESMTPINFPSGRGCDGQINSQSNAIFMCADNLGRDNYFGIMTTVPDPSDSSKLIKQYNYHKLLPIAGDPDLVISQSNNVIPNFTNTNIFVVPSYYQPNIIGLWKYVPTYKLTVTNSGNGTVTSPDSSINCGTTCSASYASATSVPLTATPNTGYQFSGWSGDCTGTGPCNVTMNSAKNVTATFKAITYDLVVTNSGNGVVKSSDSLINCGVTCSATYNSVTNVALTATPNAGYQFIGWGGACTGTGACNVTMNSATNVTAAFQVISYNLSVTNSGNGVVKSSDSTINCGLTCSATYNSGATVALTATPNTGYQFTGWGGACTGTEACNVTLSSAKNVTATFAQNTVNYTLTAINPVNGVIKSTDSLINCGTVCSASYSSGAVVSLTATPNAGFQFTGWGGACTGTGACNVTMSSAKNVTATFTKTLMSKLLVSNLTSGGGTVTSVDGAINCGTVCSSYYVPGTSVTLNFKAKPGYYISSLGGYKCGPLTDPFTNKPGTASCVVQMTTGQYNVLVTFSKIQYYNVGVYVRGVNATVTVNNTDVCSTGSLQQKGCTFTYVQGTTVTFVPSPIDRFVRWYPGWCGGTGYCSYTPHTSSAVVANFK